MGDDQCHGHCVNVHGSYHCDCPAGMTLNADQKSCDGILSLVQHDIMQPTDVYRLLSFIFL